MDENTPRTRFKALLSELEALDGFQVQAGPERLLEWRIRRLGMATELLKAEAMIVAAEKGWPVS